MTDRVTPAKLWRSELMRFSHPHDPKSGLDPEQYFRMLCEREYAKAKQELKPQNANTVSEGELQTARGSVFGCAVALLAYGQLDVVADILENSPYMSRNYATLTSCVSKLVPLPEELKSPEDRNAILSWIEEHRSELVWSEEEGKFILVAR